jgi:hypothetical protein
VRIVGPAGVEERGKGMGWTLQEPGSSDVDQSLRADGAVAENGAGPARWSPPRGSELRDARLERDGESISGSVVGIGSRSALIVLMTLGNAAQADPTEGSGAPCVQSCF